MKKNINRITAIGFAILEGLTVSIEIINLATSSQTSCFHNFRRAYAYS